jgi:hypothetical protein
MNELIIEHGRSEKNYWRDLWRYRMDYTWRERTFLLARGRGVFNHDYPAGFKHSSWGNIAIRNSSLMVFTKSV